MDALLPEELLREILSHNLTTALDAFFHFHFRWEGPARVLYVPPSRSSHLLLVSKRWLRVGTPLLYASLRLASPEHAGVVATLFRREPGVGRAVRWLRLEGGFGRDLGHVVKLAPGIHSVYVGLEMRSRDSVAGLKHAFAALSPVCLWIEDDAHRGNRKIHEARMLLYTHIANVWQSLKTVTLPEHCWMHLALAIPLAKSSIEELSCDAFDANKWIEEGLMGRILDAAHLRRVVCRGTTAERGMRRLLKVRGLAPADVAKFSFVHGPGDDNMLLQSILAEAESENAP
ncbi:hypothetical protein PsYK624_139290 [Phanerochaete sordida]|uniref:Uncharacterized protein n=1 Tax=Phanerochaete sordida TaxID=48140 RepID=A0A9P3LJS8_9APHY|nr:hypothetical protein PsYK624_139290 [Phanerochaete sordida]